MRASPSANSLRAAMGTISRVAALCLLLGTIWALLGCGGAYRNGPMATTAPMSTPTPSSNPPMPMHRSHK
jgi:hypothetical protein